MENERDTPTEIINEAKKIIDEKGESALRVTELAKRCGISTSVLYHHFKDRDDIIDAVRVAEYLARIEFDAGSLGELAQLSGNAAAIIELLVDDMADPYNERRRQFRHERMRAIVAARLDPQLQARLAAAQGELSKVIMSVIADAKRTGVLDESLDPKAVGFLLEVIPLGTALATVYGDNAPDKEAWSALLTRVFAALTPQS